MQNVTHINESLRSYPYIDKNRGVVDKDPFRCYIKFILQIWKVFLITKPYKRLENTIIKTDFSGLFNTTVLTLLNSFIGINLP